MQVRLHDYAARTKLLVILNGQMHEKQWHDRIYDEDAEKIEQGIRLAATACVKALREGLSVGFATNMPVDAEKESVCIMPSEGNGWEERLLATFARLEIIRTQHFPVLLDSLRDCTGMDMLILSTYESDGIRTATQRLQQNGNRVVFQRLEGGQP